MLTDVWPLFGLVLRTPRLELRVPSLDQLVALARLADEGIHDPAVMPFTSGWSDLPPGERGRSVLQWQWHSWAGLTPRKWSVEFVVIAGGKVVGLQALGATDFAVTREVHTGSWLGRRHHGQGIGTEMRAAVLHLAFAGLGADWARTTAMGDNAASLGVTRKLGYTPDGLEVDAVRGRQAVSHRFRMDRATWDAHHGVPVEIEGLEPCRELLGAVSPAGAGAPGP